MKGKKYIIGMLGLTVAGALVLTGCGNNKNIEQKDEGKKLVCTLDMSSELSGLGNMFTSIEFDYDKDGKEIKKATLGIDVEITSEDVTDEMLEALEKNLKENCNDATAEFDSCDVTRNEKKIQYKAVGDPKKMEDLSDIGDSQAIEDVKKAVESEGFTCK